MDSACSFSISSSSCPAAPRRPRVQCFTVHQQTVQSFCFVRAHRICSCGVGLRLFPSTSRLASFPCCLSFLAAIQPPAVRFRPQLSSHSHVVQLHSGSILNPGPEEREAHGQRGSRGLPTDSAAADARAAWSLSDRPALRTSANAGLHGGAFVFSVPALYCIVH